MADRWEYRDDRDYRHERPMTDRAGDEVRSWFGDDEAARRRRMDDVRHERNERVDRDWSDRAARSGERAWDRTREAVRNWTDRDRDGRTGLSEFADNDRASYYSGYSRPDYGNDYWRGERSYGDTARYATADPYPRTTSPYSSASYGWQGTNYAGRGPKGYQRTDDRIREEVCDRLTDDPRIDASDVEVQIKAGEVTLSGSVRTRDEKRYTEDVVERIGGVREVNNHLRVRPSNEVLGTSRSGASVLGLTDTPPPQTQTRNH